MSPADPPGEAGAPPAEGLSPFAVLQRRAVVEITPRVMEVAGLAETVDVRIREYVRACRPARAAALPGMSARRDWPVPLLLDPSIAPSRHASIPGNDPSGCSRLWDGVRQPADRLAAALEDLHAFARSKGVLPGHLRDALAEHDLEGWGRYARR